MTAADVLHVPGQLDSVALHGTVTMQNAADAAAILEASQSKLAPMKGYVQRYHVHVEGDKVLFDLEATEARSRSSPTW